MHPRHCHHTGGRRSSSFIVKQKILKNYVRKPEQSNIHFTKKRGRPPKAATIRESFPVPPKIPESKTNLENKSTADAVTEVSKKVRRTQVTNAKKSRDRQISSSAVTSSCDSLPTLLNEAFECIPNHESHSSYHDPLFNRSRRQRNLPKWTENMVMGYNPGITNTYRPGVHRGLPVTNFSKSLKNGHRSTNFGANCSQKKDSKGVKTKSAATRMKQIGVSEDTVDKRETEEARGTQKYNANNIIITNAEEEQHEQFSKSREKPLAVSNAAQSLKKISKFPIPSSGILKNIAEEILQKPNVLDKFAIISEVPCSSLAKFENISDTQEKDERPLIESFAASSVEMQKPQINSKAQASTNDEKMIEKDRHDSEVFTHGVITRRKYITVKKKTEKEVKYKSNKSLGLANLRKVNQMRPKANKSQIEGVVTDSDTMNDKDHETRNSPNPRPTLLKHSSAYSKSSTEFLMQDSLEKLEQPQAKRTRLAEQKVTKNIRVNLQHQHVHVSTSNPSNEDVPTTASNSGLGTDSNPTLSNVLPDEDEESLSGDDLAGIPKLVAQNRLPPIKSIGDSKHLSTDSSESEGDIVAGNNQIHPSRSNSIKPYIKKDDVMKFIQTKISNRNLFRIQQELLQLRQNGTYFKLTKTAPLTAGVILEMFCPALSPSASCSSGGS